MKFHCQTLHNHWDIGLKKKTLSTPLKVPHNWLFCSNQMQQWFTMRANDATMNIMIRIHIFLSLIPFRGSWIHLYLKDYPTHEGVNSHVVSVTEYLLTSQLSTVTTQTLKTGRWQKPSPIIMIIRLVVIS